MHASSPFTQYFISLDKLSENKNACFRVAEDPESIRLRDLDKAKDDVMYDDEKSKTLHGYILESTFNDPRHRGKAMDTLNKDERQLWWNWDKRNEEATNMSTTGGLQHSSTSDSSATGQVMKKEQHEQRRKQAQKKLTQHAARAMKLWTGESKDEPTGNSGAQHERRQSGGKQTPDDLLSSVGASFEERYALADFIGSLINVGVKVLKLNRRHHWQLRCLRVSKEFVVQRNPKNAGVDAGQRPKALLWPKRMGTVNCSVCDVKANGQGGLIFSKLTKLEMVSESPYFSRVPKALKAKFPSFQGVSADYLSADGPKQVLFCFKSRQEAEAFHTAMNIIKDVTEREQEQHQEAKGEQKEAAHHPPQEEGAATSGSHDTGSDFLGTESAEESST